MKKYIINLILGLFVFVACSEKTQPTVKPTVRANSTIKNVKTPPKHDAVPEFIPEHIRLSHIEVVPHY